MLQKIPTQNLFFKVNDSPLRAIIDNTMVTPERYHVLHEGIKFLGIKPTEKERNQVFYLEHFLAYKCAKEIAESISSELQHDRSFNNEDDSKAIIFLGKGGGPEKYIKLPEGPLFEDIDYSLIQQLDSYGFSPAIAVQNGFDYLDRTTFYLLVELKISEYRSGYLTIAKHKFTNNTIVDVLNLPEKKDEYCIRDVKRYAIPFFKEALRDFLFKYETLSGILANPEELIGISLDIFNKNRNLESLRSDENLLNEIQKFIYAADGYFTGKKHMGHLINFIATLHFIDFSKDKISPTVVSDILTEKKAYTNLPRLFAGKNEKESERRNYIEEHVRVLRAIPVP